ncbi:MAG: M23 family metallopeptidase [Saprospiraceae bacterium]
MILLFLFSMISLESFNPIEVYTVEDPRNIIFMCRNNSSTTYSVNLKINSTGLRGCPSHKAIVVHQGETKQMLRVKKRNSYYYFDYEYTYSLGNYRSSKHDDSLYELPFILNRDSFQIIQGYDGKFSHKKIKALDFLLPYETTILCARSGKVLKVIDHNNKGCGTKKCASFNNYILIEHEDGTIANYSHLSPYSSLVTEGQNINVGNPIAKSGSTGWSTIPHLHFEVYEVKSTKNKSVKTKFSITNKPTLLEEGMYPYPK